MLDKNQRLQKSEDQLSSSLMLRHQELPKHKAISASDESNRYNSLLQQRIIIWVDCELYTVN